MALMESMQLHIIEHRSSNNVSRAERLECLFCHLEAEGAKMEGGICYQ